MEVWTSTLLDCKALHIRQTSIIEPNFDLTSDMSVKHYDLRICEKVKISVSLGRETFYYQSRVVAHDTCDNIALSLDMQLLTQVKCQFILYHLVCTKTLYYLSLYFKFTVYHLITPCFQVIQHFTFVLCFENSHSREHQISCEVYQK